MALAAALLISACVALPSVRALAEDAPHDVTLGTGLAVPAAPEGFAEVVRGTVRWEFPERARGVVEPLFEVWDRALPRIERELGADATLSSVRVRVGTDPDEMAALAPVGAPPPTYAVGVAYPGLSLILLTLTAPETWQRPPLSDVLVHEMSHVALHAALAAAGSRADDVPLWFVEGVAIHQARERSIERVETLWLAAFRGAVLPLDELDRSFPSQPHEVSLAYAESADFVAWLMRRSDPTKLAELIGRVRRGQRFELAIAQTWSAGLGALELEWREDLSSRFGALPMFASGSVGWVLAGFLVFVAWRKRNEQRRVIERRWAEEDAREERIARALARHRARLLARERDRLPDEVILATEDAPSERDGGEPSASTRAASPPEATTTAASSDAALAIVTSATSDPSATLFVVGSPSRAPSSTRPVEPSDDFDHDLERHGRPLH